MSNHYSHSKMYSELMWRMKLNKCEINIWWPWMTDTLPRQGVCLLSATAGSERVKPLFLSVVHWFIELYLHLTLCFQGCCSNGGKWYSNFWPLGLCGAGADARSFGRYRRVLPIYRGETEDNTGQYNIICQYMYAGLSPIFQLLFSELPLCV